MVNVFIDGFRRSSGQKRIFSNSIGFVLIRQVLVTSRKGEIGAEHATVKANQCNCFNMTRLLWEFIFI